MSLDQEALILGDFDALGSDLRTVPIDAWPADAPRLVAPNDDDWDVGGFLPDAAPSWKIVNALPVHLILYIISSEHHRLASGKVPGGSPKAPAQREITPPGTGTFTYVAVEATSGAFVMGFNAKSGDTVVISASLLRLPNRPGLPSGAGWLPTPANSGSPLPADSPPVLVGAAVLPTGYVAARTEHWEKTTESYSLPPCSSLVVTLTEKTGITRSTSSMAEIGKAAGLSVGVGWGPISASFSASLSRMSSSTQELTITSSSEATVIHECENPYETGLVVLFWRLVDRLLIISKDKYFLKAMVEYQQGPAVPMAYDPAGKPFPPPGALLCPKDPPGPANAPWWRASSARGSNRG